MIGTMDDVLDEINDLFNKRELNLNERLQACETEAGTMRTVIKDWEENTKDYIGELERANSVQAAGSMKK